MNWVKILTSNKAISREELNNLYAVADWYMQYGQQKGIQNQWKEIIAHNKDKVAHKQIDDLIKIMETNRTENGFFGANDDVFIGHGQGFKLDDPELYKLYFENLKTIDQQTPKDDEKSQDGLIIVLAIRKTVKDYLGKTITNARTQRLALTSIEITDDGIVTPSIKNQRNKGTGLCTEMAAISHNLWLLAGKTSYFVNSKTCELSGAQGYENDGHAFCIVEYDGKYRMCDFAMNNLGPMEGNPIQAIKDGQSLNFGKTQKNTYIAADLTLEQSMENK